MQIMRNCLHEMHTNEEWKKKWLKGAHWSLSEWTKGSIQMYWRSVPNNEIYMYIYLSIWKQRTIIMKKKRTFVYAAQEYLTNWESITWMRTSVYFCCWMWNAINWFQIKAMCFLHEIFWMSVKHNVAWNVIKKNCWHFI